MTWLKRLFRLTPKVSLLHYVKNNTTVKLKAKQKLHFKYNSKYDTFDIWQYRY